MGSALSDVVDAAGDAFDRLDSSASPVTWAQALDGVTDLSRTAVIAVLLTVLALRCLDVVRELFALVARPLAFFAMLCVAIHWLGVVPADFWALLREALSSH